MSSEEVSMPNQLDKELTEVLKQEQGNSGAIKILTLLRTLAVSSTPVSLRIRM